MKIWLIKEGEPLPCDDSPRLMRMGLLAQYLCANGHDVTWWSSSFEHGKKKDRTDNTEVLNMFETGKLVLLYSKIVYKKNISPSRLIYHKIIANKFLELACNKEKPDLIFCAFPTIDFAEAAIKYGKKFQVPVVIDVRDLWPDIFVRAFPKPLRFLSRPSLAVLQKKTRWILKNATSITAINPSHLSWALTKISKDKSYFDRSIFIGYQKATLNEQDRFDAECFWDKLGITNETWNICYIGTMSPMTLDMETVINGFKQLSSEYPKMRLILCGQGDGLDLYKKIAGDNECILFPGWVDKKQITTLLERCKIGLYPFHNLPDFINSFTNKIIEYFSGSVPVASCLTGYSKVFISDNNVGYLYQEGDIDSFIGILKTAYSDNKERKTKSVNALNCYKNMFTDEISNRQFIELFNDIINTN